MLFTSQLKKFVHPFFFGSLSLVSLCSLPAMAAGKKCLHISSYTLEYEWAAGIDDALWKQLNESCSEKRTFLLDAKIHPEDVEKKAAQARDIINAMKPDVVVVSDDPAVKNVLQKYYKDSSIPFVFCGVNWSASEYGLPYSNATGMIEVNAIDTVVEEALRLLPKSRRGYCLAEPSETGRKLCNRFSQIFQRSGVSLVEHYPTQYADWAESFVKAQKAEYDFVVLPVVHGIKGFDFKKAERLALENTRKLTLAVYNWMVPLTMLSFVTPPEEQGEYAGIVAAKILQGAKPADFPVVTNRRWNLIINERLAAVAKISLPPTLLRKATKAKDQ